MKLSAAVLLTLTLKTAAIATTCSGVHITLTKSIIPDVAAIHVISAAVGGRIVTTKATFTQIPSNNHDYCLSHCTSIGIGCAAQVKFNTTSADNAVWNVINTTNTASSSMRSTIAINGFDSTPIACSSGPCHITHT